ARRPPGAVGARRGGARGRGGRARDAAPRTRSRDGALWLSRCREHDARSGRTRLGSSVNRPPVRPPSYRSDVRIYFVGSHATGKTTLCRYVSRRYGLPMISEVARAVLAEMETSFDALRTDMDLVAEYQERVFQRQVAIEKQHEGRFVSDRAFDNVA